MRYCLALLLAMLSAPAFAKDVTITLNDDEQKALMSVLDQAVRQGGLASVPQIWKFVMKVQDAVKQQGSPPITPPTSPPEPPKPEGK